MVRRRRIAGLSKCSHTAVTDLARDLGVGVNTAKAWLSVLESTYQVITVDFDRMVASNSYFLSSVRSVAGGGTGARADSRA